MNDKLEIQLVLTWW